MGPTKARNLSVGARCRCRDGGVDLEFNAVVHSKEVKELRNDEWDYPTGCYR
uniref:Uncharacterized protein n=1 Tax=Oryza brachyantha TaxID=4533 RepID=J3MWU2_ORYBR